MPTGAQNLGSQLGQLLFGAPDDGRAYVQGQQAGALVNDRMASAARSRAAAMIDQDRLHARERLTPEAAQAAGFGADASPFLTAALLSNDQVDLRNLGDMANPVKMAALQQAAHAAGLGDMTTANDNLAIAQGKPLETARITEGQTFNPYGSSSQPVHLTALGDATVRDKAADVADKLASAGVHDAQARLYGVQADQGGFNPHAGGGSGGPAAAPGDVTKFGDAYLSTLNPAMAAQVKALDEGRLAFPTGTALKAPYWQEMLSAVSQFDPSFEAANYNARAKTRSDFTSGKSAQTINSLNTVLGHMGDLSDAADHLNNTGLPIWNHIANAALSASGDPRVKEFEANKKAVVDEMTRVYRGTGGSEQDIKSWSDALDAAGSPEQLQGVIGKISELLQSKINALTDQYHQGMGTIGQHQSFISPRAESTLQKLEQRGGMHELGDQVVPVLGAAVQAAPAAAASAQGSTYRAVDPKTGHAVVWNGSAWVDER